MEEKAVIQTTHTHRGPATSVFLQKQNNEPLSSTYFDQKVPVPEEDTEVIHESTRNVEKTIVKVGVDDTKVYTVRQYKVL